MYQEKYAKRPDIDAVAERIGAEYETATGRRDVLQAFRDLIVLCSDSTFMVRTSSFPPTELEALEKSQAASVRYFFCTSS